MPEAVLGMSSWLTERARAEAAKAPPMSPQLVADVAALMGWVPAPAVLAIAS